MEKIAVALCRVSSARQRVEGNSLESQEKHVFDFAREKLNCEIVTDGGYWKLDVSSKAGKNIKRKDLLEIRQYCKEHKQIKYFVVDKVNRLMREIKMFYWFIQELENIDVRTYFADPEQQDLNTDDPVAQIKMFLAIYEAERDNKERSSTCITRLKDRILLGYHPFPLLQGYKKSETPALHIPDGENFKLLKIVFENIAEEKQDIFEAFRDLTAQGYKTPSGKVLRIDKFKELLKSDFYAGFVSVKKWKDDEKFQKIKGLHIPMITPEQHTSIISILTRGRTFKRQKHNPEFPNANLFNHYCGGHFTGANQGNKRQSEPTCKLYPKYRCRVCYKQINRQEIHSQFDLLLNSADIRPELQSDFEDALKEVWTEKQKDNLNFVSNLKRRHSELEEQKNNTIFALAQNPKIADDIAIAIGKLKEEIAMVQNQIIEAENIEKDLVEFVNFSLNFAREKSKRWWEISFEDRKKCKQILFPEEIVVDFSGKVCTTQISTFLKLKHSIEMVEKDQKNRVVELRGVAPLSKR